ncbi:MAG: homoserine kinase [Acidobacteriota bacterium]
MSTTEIIIPASTSNLGASFDACGLALSLHLRVEVEPRDTGFEIIPEGQLSETIPRDESNLILHVAQAVAEQRGRKLAGARLAVESAIPLARGLGSSSSAIIAGISVYESLAGERLTEEEIFNYALCFEEHGDNLAPSLLGGLVVACVVERDNHLSLVTVKRCWPQEIKIVLAVPDFEMETSRMRAALPSTVPMRDAVFNLQRAALLQAAISEKRFDLLSEALRDRLHQPFRAPLAPGLADVLKLNDETNLHSGLLGVAISGAGSTMIAFTIDNSDQIAEEMRRRLESRGVGCRTMEATVDNVGRVVR